MKGRPEEREEERGVGIGTLQKSSRTSSQEEGIRDGSIQEQTSALEGIGATDSEIVT